VTDSTFKQALSRLEVGSTELQLIENPEGDFVWPETDLPRIFVAGGIGVTPFRSMLKQRAHDSLPLDVTLIYGGRTEDVPFKDELSEGSEADPRLQVKYVIGEPLTAEKLAEVEPGLNGSLVYLSGPEQMVHALGAELVAHGLPEAQLKHDGFP